MIKVAGILDPVHKTLAPDVWDDNRKLLPPIRKAILRRLKTKFPMEQIKEVFIIGSITGYQYGADSDIDINVSIDVPQDTDMKLKTHAVKDINGEAAPGSSRPINFFVQRYYPEVEQNYKKAKFGVYDVIENRWINPPVEKGPEDDPDIKFAPELRIAHHMLDKFGDLASKYFDKLEEIKNSDSAHHRAKQKMVAFHMLGRLWEIADEVENERKMAYRFGWGVPRESFQNIVYKVLQGSRYGNLFKQLESYDDKNKIDKLLTGYSEEEFKRNQ